MQYLSELHKLAKEHEKEIKESIAKRFSLSVDKLEPLINNEDGVFLSDSHPSVFCCLVVSMENKCLYLTTADIDKDGEFGDFTARVVG